MMKSLPSKLFKDCRRLHRVDIHNTEITIDILRKVNTFVAFLSMSVKELLLYGIFEKIILTSFQLDGWDKFEERHHR